MNYLGPVKRDPNEWCDFLAHNLRRSRPELDDADRIRRALMSEVDAALLQLEMRLARVAKLFDTFSPGESSLACAKTRLDECRDVLAT